LRAPGAGETGFAGAEGATAPELSGRRTASGENSGKQALARHRRCKQRQYARPRIFQVLGQRGSTAARADQALVDRRDALDRLGHMGE
jgi:hypothetical protein